MRAQIQRAVVLFIAVLLLSSLDFAQTGTAAVRGTVADPQGRVVPDATVVLTNVANDAVRTQKTGPVGNFSFDLIPPGDYRVSAEAPGFKKAELQAVHALVATPLDLSIASLGAGDKDRALSYLERAADERVMRVTELNMATFDELRVEPRFAKISERLGLPG